ncbi:hypothetical protein [Alloalcanivorax marinus]|uniref:hypothetical protein n=1 Tax=Alloalcanivorax marinus TaxID=1177169 RepID=UPI0019349AC9|nr:hypothetical protein [Alloalcanivorax marinus]MBL7252574.1 hypothetical protein [Alloalcanivorax marinus]
MMEERYPYKPKLLAAIVTVVFFGVLAGFMGFFSLDNDRGLVLNGIIHFSRMGATIFYWVITFVLAAFSVLGLLLIFKSLTSKGELIITDQYVRAPKSGISKKIITVPFNDVEKVSVQEVKGTVFFKIIHRKGKLTIVSSVLPKREDFEYVKKHILAHVRC